MSKDIDHVELDKITEQIDQHQAMLTHLESTLMKTLTRIAYRKDEIRKLSLKRTEVLNLKLDLPEPPAPTE